jgi:hypothetical protein
MKWMTLFIFGGLGLFALLAGVIWGFKRAEFLRSGVRAQGVVVDQFKSVSRAVDDEDRKARTGPNISYYPVVEFASARGEAIRFQGSTGSGVPEYEIGTRVIVVYQPNDPQQAKILSFSQFWLGPLVVSIAGLVFFSMGVGAFFLIGQSDRRMDGVQELIRQQMPKAGP